MKSDVFAADWMLRRDGISLDVRLVTRSGDGYVAITLRVMSRTLRRLPILNQPSRTTKHVHAKLFP